MLSGAVNTTPRPRPPGRARRIAKSSPPPPYVATSLPHDLLDNLGLQQESLQDSSANIAWDTVPNDWNDKSSEELSDLLVKADELIKNRENELSLTNAVCKSLYENNLELKNKHQALLARLPISSPSVSPSGSSVSSPTTPRTPLPHSPHYYTNVPLSSSRASASAPRSRRSRRRVSVSSSDLALLSDQNAELLAKLERLESESAQNDQAGRRKLRSLEKEIQGLREELDKTRARSDELEEKAKSAALSLESEEALRKRQEREERLRALRNRSDSGTSGGEVMDFAPGGALTISRTRTETERSKICKLRTQSLRRHASEAIFHSTSTASKLARKASLCGDLSQSSPQFQFPPAQAPVPEISEHALMSQLLQKIHELEQINAQITEQQAKTTASLQLVQRDAASIRLIYESLGDADTVDLLPEDDNVENPCANEDSDPDEEDEEDETIRFEAPHRSLLADPSVDIDSDIEPERHGSLRHAVVPDCLPTFSYHRVRRSVVGLFDLPAVSDNGSPPSMNSLSIPGLPPIPFVPQPSPEFTTTAESDLLSNEPVLPTESLGRQTLDNELGPVWHGCTGNDHFRTPSLISLTSLPSFPSAGADEVDFSDKSTPSAQDYVHNSTPSISSSALLEWQDAHDSDSVTYSPPNQHMDTPVEKKNLKLQTIRMRTSHWNEGRFEATLLSAPRRENLGGLARPSTPVPQRLANEFDAAVDAMNLHRFDTPIPVHEQRGTGPSSAAIRQGKKLQQRGFVAFILELWLWLQFVIVVVVFVWAMAKRGPKSVLEETQRRKVR